MTTERVYQEDILMSWLTRPPSQDGMGWTGPAGGKGSSTSIDPTTGLLWADTLDFLKGGNNANRRAWAQLMDRERRASGAKGAEDRAVALAKLTLSDRLEQADSVLELLRSPFVIQGVRFSLWNRKPSTGDRQQDLNKDVYSQNILRATTEVPVVGDPLPDNLAAGIGGRAGKAGFRPRIRLDIGFHLNGIPYACIEVKSAGSGQTAKNQGRKQMAQDFADFAIPALLRLRADHESSEQKPWPGLAASQAKLPDVWRRRAINALPLWMSHGAWRATLDMDEAFVGPRAWDALLKVDALLMKQTQARQVGEPFDWGKSYDELLSDLISDTGRLPDVLLDDQPRSSRCGWDQPKAHLQAMLGTTGLDQEIHLYGHRVGRKDIKTTFFTDLLTPRPPQRAALGQIMAWSERMYAHESEPNWIEEDLRRRLEASMPGLTQEDVEHRVQERLRFRNGQEAYSVIIQGAAGVGKTHLAVWTALTLHGELEKDASGKYTSQPMFDYIVVLTDRVELRKNIAEAADTNRGSRGMVQEIETGPALIDTLSGSPEKGTGRILVVNLQKFPSLLEKIQSGELVIRRKGGRVAFIIDEIHRSNEGKLNSQTLDSFMDGVGSLGANTGTAGKKNLIIGMTATTTDTILARFGQWRPGTGAGNPGDWTPHFAYGMQQAIDDKHILDPRLGLMRLETILDIDEHGTLEGADGDPDLVAEDIEHLSLYEHPEYQRQVAEAFARIFSTTTMSVMRESNKSILVGRGKAMITMPSVKAAILMQQAVKAALLKEAGKPKGEAWERYAHIVKDVAENRVFILYSNPGKRATISQRDETGIDGGCGALNPTLEGKQRTEAEIIEGFRCKEAGKDGKARNAIIIVVDKLLTGFDESSLHTLMLCRKLQGVGLLQAMCRVNRTREGKENCLVIDASYDPRGQGLAPEAARVFHRYGGLAASRLDGLGLYSRIIEQRLDLMKHKDVAQGWRDWREAKNDEAKKMGAVSLAASDIKRAVDGELAAKRLRRFIGGYLSLQRLAAPIMNLERKDLDPEFLAYLLRLHNHLKQDGPGDDRVPVQFTVCEVDFTSGTDLDSIMVPDHTPKKISPLKSLEEEWVKQGGAGEATDFEDLQKQQDEKVELVRELRQAVEDLSQAIDLVAQERSELVVLLDSLKNQQLDPSEAIEGFSKLAAAANVLLVDTGNGKKVMWKNLVPGRRRIIDWMRVPQRLGYTMGAWLETAAAPKPGQPSTFRPPQACAGKDTATPNTTGEE